MYLSKYREIEGEKLNIPKQQRSEQKQQQQQQQQSEPEQNIPYNTNVYSSANLLSHHPSFVPSDQPFPLPFSPNSIQKQLQQQDQIDSVGNW